MWKHLLGIAYQLLWIVPALATLMLMGGVSSRRPAQVLSDGRIEFPPDRLALWAWPVVAAAASYTAWNSLKHTRGDLLQLAVAAGLWIVAVEHIFSFPGTITVAADGLEQTYWLRPSKHILWNDIVEIDSERKGGAVTITSTESVKIVHMGQLADRPRLLLELKLHCGQNLPPDFPREPLPELPSAGKQGRPIAGSTGRNQAN